MALSGITAPTPIAERSEATPGLWNARFNESFYNTQSLYSNVSTYLGTPISTNTIQPESGNTVRLANTATLILRSVDSGPAFFDPRAFGAALDGSTADDTAFAAASSAASNVGGPGGGILVLSTGTLRLSSQQTVWPSVTVFPAGGRLALDSGVRVTVQGSVTPVATQWITSASTGSVVFDAHSPVGDVYAIWWGARSSATTGGSTDQTSALSRAIMTGRNVLLLPGAYGYTGGLVADASSQGIFGAGRWDPATPHTGTVLYKLSGTGFGLRFRQVSQRLADLTLDGHNLAGTQLDIEAAKYLVVERVNIRNQGGTDYAMKLYNVGVTNLCDFRDMIFGPNYGNIQIHNALYCRFFNVTLGDTTGGAGLDCGKAGEQAVSQHFYSTYVDSKISIHDVSEDIHFFGLTQEDRFTGGDPVIDISGSDVQGVFIDGFRVNQASAATAPIVRVKAQAKNVVIKDMKVRDSASAAGQAMIELDDALYFTVEDANIYANNAFDFINGTGVRSDHVTVKRIHGHSGGAGTMRFECAFLTVEDTNAAIVFLAGNNDAHLTNCSGTINTANVGSECVVAGQAGVITDAGFFVTRLPAEKSVWTGTLTPGTSGSITMGTAVRGTYARKGREVTFGIYVNVASVSSPVGALLLSGLPYAAANSGTSFRTAVSVRAADLAAAATTDIQAFILDNESQIRIVKFAAGASSALAGDVQANSEFYVGGTYFIA